MVIGRIYKIIHNQSDVVYVGSTLNILKQRWQQHKANYKKWLNEETTQLSIYPYFQEHGIENFKLLLIKEYEVCDKAHLKAYEQLWINKLNCFNKNKAFRISKYYNLEYNRLYRVENKENKAQTNKLWYESNKQRIKKKNTDKTIKKVYLQTEKTIIKQIKNY